MFMGIGQILPRAAARHGDKTALMVGERALTYAELDRQSNRLANALIGLGVVTGDRVTLYGLNCVEWVVGYHALAKLGAVINPINVMLTPEEVVFVTRDCEASAILIGPEKLEAFLDVARDTPVREVVALGSAKQAGVQDFETLLGAASDDFHAREVSPDAAATIGYTSGTTGHPKGAMQSQRAVTANIALTATMHVKTAPDTVVTALPLPHVYGNVVVNGGLMTGMTVVLLARFEERTVLQAIQRHRATMLEGVPTMYQYLLNSPELERHDLSSLTRCTVGGQTMPVAKMQEVEARFGCPLIELWGMTELAGLGTTFPAYGEIRHGSIGVALPSVQARIAAIEDATRSLPAADDQGPDRDAGLLRQRAGHAPDHRAGRLAALRRPRPDRRRRLHLRRRPQQGHDQQRRLQGLPGRGRAGARGTRERRHGRGRRPARPAEGRGAQGLRRAEAGRRGRC
jgi:long-chain acyl-CoA synthetase